MRCLACNVELSDYEATRKSNNGDYIDLCNHCFDASDYEFETNDRLDLYSEADIVINYNESIDNENIDS